MSAHADDAAFPERGFCMATWPVESLTEGPGAEGFRHFRVLQTGKNTEGKDTLNCAGLELYGDFYNLTD